MEKVDTFKKIFSDLLDRNLTEKEIQVLEWLENWENETKNSLNKLFVDLHTNGIDRGMKLNYEYLLTQKNKANKEGKADE
jgi:hypothetical protein